MSTEPYEPSVNLDGVHEMTRESVERVAHIIGPQSAAAQALTAAHEYTDPIFVTIGDMLIVTERMP